MVDLRGEVKVEDGYGNENTYTDFAGEEKAKRIDFLYVERKSKRVSNYNDESGELTYVSR